jgi:hypothetical protein
VRSGRIRPRPIATGLANAGGTTADGYPASLMRRERSSSPRVHMEPMPSRAQRRRNWKSCSRRSPLLSGRQRNGWPNFVVGVMLSVGAFARLTTRRGRRPQPRSGEMRALLERAAGLAVEISTRVARGETTRPGVRTKITSDGADVARAAFGSMKSRVPPYEPIEGLER